MSNFFVYCTITILFQFVGIGNKVGCQNIQSPDLGINSARRYSSRPNKPYTCTRQGKKFCYNNKTCICIGLHQSTCQESLVTQDPSCRSSTVTTIPQELHPLDPLTDDEIRRTKNIVNSQRPDPETGYIFNIIVLKEPPKTNLLPYFLSNTPPPRKVWTRRAFVVTIQNETGIVHEAVVNLDNDKLESWTAMDESLKPLYTPNDDTLASEITLNSREVQERCCSQGFCKAENVYVAGWPLGYVGDRPEYKNLKRPFQMFIYGILFKHDNAFAHPMDFVVIIDLVDARVVAIEELPTHDDFDMGRNKSGNTVPKTPANYDYTLQPPGWLRTSDKPIEVSAPEGPSYSITGNHIEWQGFTLRLGFNAREGVVLYNVGYTERNGTFRPLMYRMSVAEMGVFYGDPRPPFHRKFGFDEGELGIGYRSNELKDQIDCLGATHFVSVTINNNAGEPVHIKNAICITEEDAGILWKHVNYKTGKGVVARSHKLSISSMATMGNYDYSLKWEFYQDASINFKVQLTGIDSTDMLSADSSQTKYGTLFFPQVNGQYHQHLFALRYDTEIDGNNNTVYVSDSVPLDFPTGSSKNPYGNGFTTRKRCLKTQKQGRQQIKPDSGRVFIVINPNKLNPYTKQPVGWELIPVSDAKFLLREDCPFYPKFSYNDFDFWVTKYQEEPTQFFPGGFYMNNSGLPEWVENNPDESVENTDVVIWYLFRPVHITKTEDFPVVPVMERDVFWKPYNFFTHNPGIDVPPAGFKRRKMEL